MPVLDLSTMRICSTCRIPQPGSAFYWDVRARRHAGRCRDCTRAYYQANKARFRQRFLAQCGGPEFHALYRGRDHLRRDQLLRFVAYLSGYPDQQQGSGI